jgi:broad specificity phosphatase PhoE
MLIFARHGQSQANADALLVGRLDSPLTELGRLQAAALGDALAARHGAPRLIVTSPLQRAAQTAEAIATAYKSAAEAQSPGQSGAGLTVAEPRVTMDDRFVELDYGELDGVEISELPPGLFSRWSSETTWRPPGGESLVELTTRVVAACEELASEAGKRDVVVVSHVSPIKAAVIWALGGEPELSWRMSLSIASITQISTGGSRVPTLVSFNAVDHLAILR